eukprot:6466676-Amphidinium_carterae.1
MKAASSAHSSVSGASAGPPKQARGVSCAACGSLDTSADPLEKASVLFWSYYKKDGSTEGTCCWYCNKVGGEHVTKEAMDVYNLRYKVKYATLRSWVAALGTDGDLHQELQ